MCADSSAARGRVAFVTLGCARNEVDSEELAGRLVADGWVVVDEAAEADVAVVNTCGFVAAAKKDSIDVLLETADLKSASPGEPDVATRTRSVVAVGCLAERYGTELAEALPEADAVLGFDDYAAISARLAGALAGERHESHLPRDRRRLLPLAPADRQPQPLPKPRASATGAATGGAPAYDGSQGNWQGDWQGPGQGPRPVRRRLGHAPVAPLKLASGCDRRCSFCAIPSFRGAFVSRPPAEVLAEAGWLAEQGVRELVLVSENSTSYGKDLGDVRLLEGLLPRLAGVAGVDRVRVSYLQPAELRPSLVDVLTGTPGVAAYFDLSFQHASGPVLRRMRRFGDAERFLDLLAAIRARAPLAGARSNVIVGFPGESEADVAELERFLVAARLDAVGVFGYSDEDGTEAAGLDGKLPDEVVRERVERVTRLAEELCAQRAEERVGEDIEVLVEQVTSEAGNVSVEGRAAHQAPEVDGTVTLLAGPAGGAADLVPMRPGQLVRARVTGATGVDLVGVPLSARAGARAGAQARP